VRDPRGGIGWSGWERRWPGSRGPVVTGRHDPRVDAYIDALPDWQQAICREVRALVLAADPQVSETIKRTNRPYFVLHGTFAPCWPPRTT